MIKTIYEKILDVEKKKTNNPNFFDSFYLGPQAKINIFIGIKDAALSLCIEFDKKEIEDSVFPEINGIQIQIIDAPYLNPNKKFVCITNKIKEQEMFIAFVSSICDKLSMCQSQFDAVNVILKEIKEYKNYFSNANTTLSLYEEQGLCAELIELKKFIAHFGEQTVLNWEGPNKNKRDFVFENFSLEVKSTKNQTNTSILISNENQLDSSFPSEMKQLFLSVYVFEKIDGNAINIISCAKDVLEKINSIEYKRIFIAKLLKLKIDLSKYKCKFNFSLQNNFVYHVTDKFPKISKSILPSSIFDVKYRLDIKNLENFKIKEEKIYE